MSASPANDQVFIQVLIACDDAQMGAELRRLLAGVEAELTACKGWEDAGAAASGGRPTVVIMAPAPSNSDAAAAFCRRIRVADRGRLTPIVVVAEPGPSAQALLDAGANIVVPPSTGFDHLPAQVDALLRCSKMVLDAFEEQAFRLADETWTDEQLEYLVHDLKSPLASILTSLYLLDQQFERPQAKRLLSDGKSAVNRLERMILNVLDVGRLEAGSLKLELIEVTLEDLVEEAVASVRPLCNSQAISLDIRLDDLADLVVRLDFDLMTRVLVNLLENAVRHSPEGAAVLIRAARESDDRLCLSVDDEGIGVPEAWRERIFRRFVQRGRGGPGRIGRGLGLAFAKSAADAHGFEIGVAPRDPRGSRFFLRMPVPGWA